MCTANKMRWGIYNNVSVPLIFVFSEVTSEDLDKKQKTKKQSDADEFIAITRLS